MTEWLGGRHAVEEALAGSARISWTSPAQV